MQALLSYDQSPPLAAPLRFFLTAPLFGILAGALILTSGPALFASRWTQEALALTHLLTAGFMLQVMLGAMVQVLPVVAGANIANGRRVAALVHAATSVGALVLAAAFLTFSPLLMALASVLLAAGVGLFVAAAAHALYRVPTTSPTIAGLKLSLVGLFVTVALGLAMTSALAGALVLPLGLPQLAGIHLVWGFVAWATVLLAAVAYVVVPMFQLTPAYPERFGHAYAAAALGVVTLWSAAEIFAAEIAARILAAAVVAIAALFAAITLKLQRASKRAQFDVTQHYWRVAMASALASCALWFAAQVLPEFDAWEGWPFLFGVALIAGGFVSVIVGMLYKIVPFLVWLSLQNLGQGRLLAPNMKKIIAEKAMRGQMLAHFAACALLVLAVFLPDALALPAGIALIAANGWLARNLVAALKVHRDHRRKIAALAQNTSTSSPSSATVSS
jgi:hypothetical protein